MKVPTIQWFVRRLAHTARPSVHRRVVVTGMGLVTCLGVGVDHVWHRLLQGDSGISKLEGTEYEKMPSKVGGLVPIGEKPGHLNPKIHFENMDMRSTSLATRYALVATEEALHQAKWYPTTEEEKCFTGVAVGMGMADMETIVSVGRSLTDRGYSKVNPHFVPRILVNMPAGNISLKYGLKGVNHSVSTACTTGVHAIGDAARFIKHGDVDVMVCGGTEATMNPLSLAGFCRMRALSTNFNENPTAASRPFDHDRDGFVMSEGAGILVLEELEHAKKRGATILGEVLGYGLSGDAHHITAPSGDGDGAYRCMEAALRDSGKSPSDIGYINAHATSTPLGDAAESRAITRLFQNCDKHKVAVSSTKSSVGHLLGAAGSIEAIFTLLACEHAMLPPTLNCHNPDTEFNLNYVPLKAQQWTSDNSELNSRVALTNSFGFGGTNASICISSYVD